MGKFELKTAKDGQTFFNLKAGNGQVILSSEMYKSKDGAENGIESVQENAPEDKKYERKESKNEKFHFNLKAGNGQVIGSSEMYESKDGMENGIESVKKNAPDAETEDLTE